MWKLALTGMTIIWDRRGIMPVMFSSQGVFTGPLEAFERQLQDPGTWCVCDHDIALPDECHKEMIGAGLADFNSDDNQQRPALLVL